MNLRMQKLLALTLASAPTVLAEFWGSPKGSFTAPHEVHQFEQVKFQEEDQWDCRFDTIAGVTGCLVCKNSRTRDKEAMIIEVMAMYKRADFNAKEATARKHCVFPGRGEFYTCFNSNLVMEPASGWLEPYSDKPIYTVNGEEYDEAGEAGTECLPAFIAKNITDHLNKKPTTATPTASPPKVDDDTCVPAENPNAEAPLVFPPTQRLKLLEDKFGFKILNSTEYAAIFDHTSHDGVFLKTEGMVTDTLNSDSQLRLYSSDVSSRGEARTVCASRCEVEECDYFHFGFAFGLKKSVTYRCHFHKKGIPAFKTKKMFPVLLEGKMEVEDATIVTRRASKVVLKSFDEVACNVPSGDALNGAIACLVGLGQALGLSTAACDLLRTDDFEKYIAPAVTCVGAEAGWPRPKALVCLPCIMEYFTFSSSCGRTDVCEPDETLNMITATPCAAEDVAGKDGCLCNACGEACTNDNEKRPGQVGGCLAEIQTAILCNKGVPPTAGVNSVTGGCINRNDSSGNFTCDDMND